MPNVNLFRGLAANYHETHRNLPDFCLLEDIRNRGRSQNKMGAPAVVRANRSSKARNERGDRTWLRCHIVPAALSLGQTGGGASLMPNRPIYTHNMYTNTNILHSIYICL